MKFNSKKPNPISRRDFLKLSSIGLISLPLINKNSFNPAQEFPDYETLGRNCTGGIALVRSRPDVNSPVIKEVYEDTVFPWIREISAENPDLNHFIQRWVETPEGYVYSPTLQPVKNLPNSVINSIPEGKAGFWAEVTIPYVDLYLDNPPARSPAIKHLAENGFPIRLYYSQVMWIDQIRVGSSGNVVYRVNENEKHGYGYGDVFWAAGEAFRPILDEEITPISPELDPAEKTIRISLTYTLLL